MKVTKKKLLFLINPDKTMQNASNFLIPAIIAIALSAVFLRFWMQWVRADFRNE